VKPTGTLDFGNAGVDEIGCVRLPEHTVFVKRKSMLPYRKVNPAKTRAAWRMRAVGLITMSPGRCPSPPLFRLPAAIRRHRPASKLRPHAMPTGMLARISEVSVLLGKLLRSSGCPKCIRCLNSTVLHSAGVRRAVIELTAVANAERIEASVSSSRRHSGGIDIDLFLAIVAGSAP